MITGICIVAIGILWPWLSKIPFGRLPGDIIINRPNMRIYFPLATMLLISLLLTLIFKIFHK
ncbi:MAG: DUF2905 domain-containing protein [Candidatus Marinimicrobia bacterium]|nr:DUF2905 domain-containing protein [Candidatus Neomarinimicrobiota bacterium]